jgi:Tfp pilus assembly protein PilN
VPIDGLVKAVNLIPSEPRATGKVAAPAGAAPAPSDRPFGAYIILGALAFAIAAVALMVTTQNGITEKKGELAQVRHDAEVVKQQASTMQAFADFKQLADARVATVSGLAAGRFPWPDALDDVSRALPSDVYVSSFDGTTSTASGGSALRTAIAAPSIELNGCTSSQASVARLMSRLRDVRGVTRVALAKSEAADVAESAAAPAPATSADGLTSAITTEPCPKGAPPAFDMIVFFERAAVSPNAALNAAAGTAAVSGPTGASGATAGPTGSAGATTPASTTSTTP